MATSTSSSPSLAHLPHEAKTERPIHTPPTPSKQHVR
ncbi:hypothetical protein Pcinc_018995, partial [Petrolisthes cinctipes]